MGKLIGKAHAEVSDVLVVEDDTVLRTRIAGALRAAGLVVHEAGSCEGAVAALRRISTAVLVTDLMLPDGDAVSLLPVLRALDPKLVVFLVTGHGSIDQAVRAVKSGAEDFLTKPVDLDRLVAAVRSAVRRRAKQSGTRPARVLTSRFVATSRAMCQVEEEVARLRESDSSVLLLGETGTGKSMLARRIHEVGRRASRAFVDVNCGGLSREFVESELFGHERGAFTGAHAAKAGLLEAANLGTLFLDEIGDVDLQVQPKILKVLEEKRFRRMGEIQERAVDVRLVAATHHDLLDAIERKAFRADLYYRISAVTITLPSLRERVEDIVPLARHLLEVLAGEPIDVAPDARDALLAYAWPGNIRELRNVVERALLSSEDGVVRARDLRFDARGSDRFVAGRVEAPSVEGSTDSIKDVEREHILRTLTLEAGRVEAAARRLGMPRSTLYQKLKTYGIEASRMRKALPSAGELSTVAPLKVKP